MMQYFRNVSFSATKPLNAYDNELLFISSYVDVKVLNKCLYFECLNMQQREKQKLGPSTDTFKWHEMVVTWHGEGMAYQYPIP